MSRGAGKVQTAVLSLIASDEDGAWTTTDVCEAVYRGANRIEKKHRVSVSRAVRTMDLPEPWAVARLERSGCEYMIFNRLSLESTLRKRWQSHYALSGISFEYFKVRYSHQIPKAEEEVAEYREYFEADELGRINIEIRDAQTSLGMLRAVGVGAEFIQSIADRITRLLERKAAFLAVLKTTETDSPHGTKVRKDAKCISYGVGWLIEIDPLKHYSYSQDIAEAPGSIHLSEHGPLMRLGANVRDGFQGTWLNLTTNEPASHPYDAYATLNWRLWLDAKDRDSPKAKPFLVFPPPTAEKKP